MDFLGRIALALGISLVLTLLLLVLYQDEGPRLSPPAITQAAPAADSV